MLKTIHKITSIALIVGSLLISMNAPLYAKNKKNILPAQTSPLQDLNKKTILAPEKTIILWDIHHVILHRKTWNTFVAVLKYNKKWQLLRKLNKKLRSALLKSDIGSSETIMEIAYQHNNKELAELVKKIANLQTPIKGTVTIINELHNNGYANHLGSNIGPNVFEGLQKKLPNIFNNTLFDISKSQIASYKKGQELSKPDLEFFYTYLRKNNIDLADTTVVFIDDKEKNVKAAQKVGMIGIVFKNPKQLRADLRMHGVTLSACMPVCA